MKYSHWNEVLNCQVTLWEMINIFVWRISYWQSFERRVSFLSFKSWWRILWMLNFICRDGVLFAKEAQTLFQHKSEKQKPFGVLQSYCICVGSVFFWTWWRIYWTLDFTCVDGVLFSNIFLTHIVISNLCAVLRFSFFRPTRGRSNQPSHK